MIEKLPEESSRAKSRDLALRWEPVPLPQLNPPSYVSRYPGGVFFRQGNTLWWGFGENAREDYRWKLPANRLPEDKEDFLRLAGTSYQVPCLPNMAIPLHGEDEEVLLALLGLADLLEKLVQLEMSAPLDDSEVEELRRKLRGDYLGFVQTFGRVNRNLSMVTDFGDIRLESLLYPLEDESGVARILRERVNRPLTRPESGGTIEEVFSSTALWQGFCTLPDLAERTGQDESSCLTAIRSRKIGMRNPSSYS